jgi:hypothetical protein
MSAAAALRAGTGDFYRQSWRLALLNTVLGVALAAVIAATLFVRTALALAVLVGPLATGLMHCCVKLVQTHELRFRDALAGVRATWRRGLALGALAVGALILVLVAVPFYAENGVWAWPLAALTAYLALVFLVLQLALWPLAVLNPERPLAEVLRAAAAAVMRRPSGFLAVAAALLVVNIAGLVAGLLPFFTLTIAYSFLVSAHLALPHTQPEAEPWRVSPTTT